MVVKQVKFRWSDTDAIESRKDDFGGIAVYESKLDKTPQYIICGCCGDIFKPEDFEIIQELEWIPISDEILGE